MSRRHWTLGAIALVVIGLLLLVPSGLCTGVFGVAMITEAPRSSVIDALNTLAIALVVGGPFIVGGAVLIYAGFRLSKRN